MLVELKSDKFRDKSLTFHSGLNVVLGDETATNSIGKSSLLMVLDFVFGGNSLVEHNKDIIDELGHHDYFFEFKFDNRPYYFKRGTYTPDLVYKCDSQYSEGTPLTVEEYRGILKSSYGLDDIALSFRSTVSLYSRVWGKDNYDVKQPLHNHKNQTSVDCIDNLLKLYGKFESIRILSLKAKELSDEKSAIRHAFKQKIIPKITKAQYKDSIQRVSEIDDEILEIKDNLAKYAVSISEIINREVADIKKKKDSLLKERSNVSARLSRVRSDLSQNKHIKSKAFSSLVKFFPNVEQNRIEEVEVFHSQITKILKNELQESERELSESLDEINSSIEGLDDALSETFSSIDKPDIIIDRVHKLAKSKISAASEIKYFETDTQVGADLKDSRKNLADEKIRILDFVQNIINNKTREYVSKVYNEERRSPVLELSQRNYTFTAVEDTGTGKAYSNLVLFDLAVFETTALPVIIHDSVLFKNIENNAVAKMIELYIAQHKQSFISIDEIQKYGKSAESLLLENKIIQLSNDKVLYIKDWRK